MAPTDRSAPWDLHARAFPQRKPLAGERAGPDMHETLRAPTLRRKCKELC